MADNPTTYGDVHISDSARAHLGNVVNHIWIEQAVFDSDGTIVSATSVSGDVSRKRRYEITSDERSVKRLCNGQESSTWSQEVCIQDPPSGNTRAETTLYTDNVRRVTLPVSEEVSSALVPTRRSFSQTLLRKIFNTAWSQHTATSSAISRQIGTSHSGLQYFPADEHSANRISRTGSANAELLSLVVALAVFLIGRHTSAEDVFRFLKRCRDDQLQPLLVLLLGIGLGRFWMSHVSRNLICGASDCITLETIFQQDIFVPFSTCADFSILSAFLKHHYRGTPAEALVKAGQFNLMLGSRRGPVLRARDWSVNGTLKPKCRIVMSAYLRTHLARCSGCWTPLQISLSGDYTCHVCDRFFRDSQSLQYLSEIAEVAARSSKPHGEGERVLPSETVDDNYLREIGSNDTRDFGSFKNVDLHIIPTIDKDHSHLQNPSPPTSSETQSFNIPSVVPAQPELRQYLQTLPALVQQQSADGQQPILNDALSYLDQIKVRFSNQPDVYNRFLDIMKDFKNQTIDTLGVITRVSRLFKGHPVLIEGFNTFLPPGYRIQCGTNEDPKAIIVTMPDQKSGFEQDWPELSVDEESKAPVEFSHAISYVNQVKVRFAQRPYIYKQFLDILQSYQRESKPIQDTYTLITQLFVSEPALLEGFRQFLPNDAPYADEAQNTQPWLAFLVLIRLACEADHISDIDT